MSDEHTALFAERNEGNRPDLPVGYLRGRSVLPHDRPTGFWGNCTCDPNDNFAHAPDMSTETRQRLCFISQIDSCVADFYYQSHHVGRNIPLREVQNFGETDKDWYARCEREDELSKIRENKINELGDKCLSSKGTYLHGEHSVEPLHTESVHVAGRDHSSNMSAIMKHWNLPGSAMQDHYERLEKENKCSKKREKQGGETAVARRPDAKRTTLVREEPHTEKRRNPEHDCLSDKEPYLHPATAEGETDVQCRHLKIPENEPISDEHRALLTQRNVGECPDLPAGFFRERNELPHDRPDSYGKNCKCDLNTNFCQFKNLTPKIKQRLCFLSQVNSCVAHYWFLECYFQGKTKMMEVQNPGETNKDWYA